MADNSAAGNLVYLPTGSGTLALTNHTHNYLPLTGGTINGKISFSNIVGSWLNVFKGDVYIDSEHTAGTSSALFRYPSTNGVFLSGVGTTTNYHIVCYQSNANINAGNVSSYLSALSYNEAGNLTISGGSFVGNLSGNASSATNATNATTADNLKYFKSVSTVSQNIDNTDGNLIGYTNQYNTHNYKLFNQSDGTLYRQCYSSTWVTEIFQDYRTGQIARRSKNNGTWTDWKALWDEYNSTPSKVSSSAPGTSHIWVY